jgi:single-strand DNA-binding protein
MNNTPITIIGNLGGDPEMRFTPTGQAVTAFTVAVAQRKYNRDAKEWRDTGTTWYRVISWGYLAEHCAESLTRGMRVIVTGNLAARQWENKEGEKRETWEITADGIGPDLTFATARITRATREDAPHPADDPAHAQPAEPASEPGEPAPAPDATEPASGPQEPAESGPRHAAAKTRRS